MEVSSSIFHQEPGGGKPTYSTCQSMKCRIGSELHNAPLQSFKEATVLHCYFHNNDMETSRALEIEAMVKKKKMGIGKIYAIPSDHSFNLFKILKRFL